LQLSAVIDPHDFGVKLAHAIEFLCDDTKVRVKLRFKGRQKAHKEFGFEVVNRFVREALLTATRIRRRKCSGSRFECSPHSAARATSAGKSLKKRQPLRPLLRSADHAPGLTSIFVHQRAKRVRSPEDVVKYSG